MRVSPFFTSMCLLSLLAVPVSLYAQPVVQDSDLQGVPKHAQSVLQRYEACLHFAGEISGEPEADQYVHRRLTELGCDRIDRDVAQIRNKYDTQPRVYSVLDKIEHEYDISR